MADEKTIKELIAEAKKELKRSQRLFNKYDNSDDMHDCHRWRRTIEWLESKL